jgi:hypothetical protein
MLEPFLEAVFGFVIALVLGVLWWLLLFPVVVLLALPPALVLAVFRRGGYWANVGSLLQRVHEFWERWGLFFTT